MFLRQNSTHFRNFLHKEYKLFFFLSPFSLKKTSILAQRKKSTHYPAMESSEKQQLLVSCQTCSTEIFSSWGKWNDWVKVFKYLWRGWRARLLYGPYRPWNHLITKVSEKIDLGMYYHEFSFCKPLTIKIDG